MKKKMFLIVVTMLLLLSTTATVFAASGEVVQPRTTQSFTVSCYRWNYFGGTTKVMPGTSGWIYPTSVSPAGYTIQGTIYEQVNGTYIAVGAEKVLNSGVYNSVTFDVSGTGVAGHACKGMLRNATNTAVQITVNGRWDPA